MPSIPFSAVLKHRLGLVVIVPILSAAIALPFSLKTVQAQANRQAITLRADVQEANSQTGVVSARGNVQIIYPAENIQASATQAHYFSRERRIVLSGNVYVLQQGNSIRGETITYLIDEGRFVALPQQNRQVESTFIIEDLDLP